MHKTFRFRLLCLSLFVVFVAGLESANAAEYVLWSIGKFDQSSLEFKRQKDGLLLTSNPVITIGQGDLTQQWVPRQAGSLNPDVGSRPHPYTILFNLEGAPQGIFLLDVSVILPKSRIPALQIEVNGTTGIFYFHRKISYDPADSGFDSPIYGSDRKLLPLAASLFKTGENRLVLTAVDDPHDGGGDSWLVYDALSLANDPAGKLPDRPAFRVEPTVFYLRQEKKLGEIVDVTGSFNVPIHGGELTLAVAGENINAPISSSADFGEWREELAIPELAGPAQAALTVRINGRKWTSGVGLVPQRKWTAFVVPNAHLDIGFTDYQAKVAEIQNRNIDKLLDEIDAHPDMRFSLDGSWIVSQYFASRDARARARFLDLVRQGRISIPAQFVSVMTGYPTMEELIRSTDFARQLHRDDKVPFDYANITDVPSYTWSYPAALNALGIRYFVAAANSDRAPILMYGRWNERSPFWWQGVDGSKVLMAYARQYFQFSFVCGVPAQEAACRQSLPAFFQQYAHDYKPDTVLMYGSQLENTDLIPGEPEFVAKWNAKFAYPRLVLATFPEYMRYIDQHFGASLPTVAGDGGPYWEDGYGTDAHYLAIDRATQQRAPSAEKLATIATFLHANVSGPTGKIEGMWEDLVMYAEHTFTSWGGYSRPESEETIRQFATKDQYAIEGHERVNAILDQGLSQLADQIHVAAPAAVVFNSLSWSRSGLVETDLDADDELVESAGGAAVPVEVLAHHADYDHVRFLARDIPSMGYRCYRIVHRTDRDAARPGGEDQPVSRVMENSYYRIEVDPAQGGIKSIYDKQLQHELVDSSSRYKFNQYTYVSGGDGDTQLIRLRKTFPFPDLTVGIPSSGRVIQVRKTSYGRTLTYQTAGPHAPLIQSEIILFDQEKKIEFINLVHKDPVNTKEGVYFAFPVAATPPDFSYEIQNGWVDPARNQMRGANAAWFTVQHWVKVDGPDLSVGLVPVDAPLVTLGDINRGTWPDGLQPSSGTIFSYIMNNYWHANFRRVQSGDSVFRYVMTSGTFLPAMELSRLGRDAMTPLEMGMLISNDKWENPPAALTTAPTSFLAVDASSVTVDNWKMADDGTGTIVRLLETSGSPSIAHLTFPLFQIEKAWRDNAAEENLEELKVKGHSIEVSIKPFASMTLRIVAPKLQGVSGGTSPN